MSKMILVRDLPQELTHAVGRDLAMYTIAFLDAADDSANLLGSGVLVSAAGTRAILTAQHVVSLLPTTGRFGIFLDKTNMPHTIDADGVARVGIARGKKDWEGPDLGVVILAPPIASSIAAKKCFYNLDLRREQMLQRPPDLDDGVWCANGFLAERTEVRPDPGGHGGVKFFYNFSGYGGPDDSPQIGEYDYFEFPVSHEARTEVPQSWGGMSGGGLWQVPLKRDGDNGLVTSSAFTLSGVLFYQWPTTPTVCGVRAHGRRSIYDVAYRHIAGASA